MTDVWDLVDQETLDGGGYAAIVNEAKERNLLPSDVPLGSGQEVVDAAKWLIETAYNAYNSGGKNGEDVNTILRMSGLDLGGGASSSDIGSREGTVTTSQEVEEAPSVPDVSTESATEETKATEVPDVKPIEFKGLPVPDEWEGEFPKLPRDVTELADLEVRRLYAQFGAILSSTLWLLSNERAQLSRAKTMMEVAYSKALKEAKGSNAETRKAIAMTDEEYTKWSNAVVEHEGDVFRFQALRDSFTGNVERLSREMTFRQEERMKVHTSS